MDDENTIVHVRYSSNIASFIDNFDSIILAILGILWSLKDKHVKHILSMDFVSKVIDGIIQEDIIAFIKFIKVHTINFVALEFKSDVVFKLKSCELSFIEWTFYFFLLSFKEILDFGEVIKFFFFNVDIERINSHSTWN